MSKYQKHDSYQIIFMTQRIYENDLKRNCVTFYFLNHEGEKGSLNKRVALHLYKRNPQKFSKGNRNVFLVTKVLASFILFTTEDIEV